MMLVASKMSAVKGMAIEWLPGDGGAVMALEGHEEFCHVWKSRRVFIVTKHGEH
jgi:hypothetical protein